jgi:hypothetical protein
MKDTEEEHGENGKQSFPISYCKILSQAIGALFQTM